MELFKNENIANPREFFKNNLICREYLSRIKWGDNYICNKCSWKKFHVRGKNLYRICNSCGTSESPTRDTIFFLIGFKITTAFSIVMDVLEMGDFISPEIVSRRYNITKKIAKKFLERFKTALNMKDKRHLFLRINKN